MVLLTRHRSRKTLLFLFFGTTILLAVFLFHDRFSLKKAPASNMFWENSPASGIKRWINVADNEGETRGGTKTPFERKDIKREDKTVELSLDRADVYDAITFTEVPQKDVIKSKGKTTTPVPQDAKEMGKEKQEEGDKEDGKVTEKQQCEPKNHVMFLKTHKCGSSTVQNIFLRYAYKRNLTLALPGSGNYLGSPNPFQASMIPMTLLPENKLVDIFAVHTRLNYQQHSKVLYKDTKWVTIVREPTALYESLYSFYEMKRYYGLGLDNFKNMNLEILEKLPRYAKKLGRNQMLFDFGYSPDADVAELRRALDDLDKIFDLVMVVEFMDESLVLLRHLLCWSQEDVLVFTKNARREKFKSSLDIHTKRVLRTINSADGILYDHFVTRHIKRVLEFGVEKMGKEVAALRALREKYRRRCVTRETAGLDSDLLYPEYSNLVNAYIVANRSDTECRLLSMPEIPLLKHVREAQRHRLHPLPPPPPRARKNEMKSVVVDPYEFLELN